MSINEMLMLVMFHKYTETHMYIQSRVKRYCWTNLFTKPSILEWYRCMIIVYTYKHH